MTFLASPATTRRRSIRLRAVFASTALLFTAACGEDDPTSAVPTQNILQTATATASLSTLNAALTAAGLGSTFTGTTKYTVFAPVNDAFAALPAGTVDALLASGNQAVLQAVSYTHLTLPTSDLV